jgi:hypothetical protein
LFEEIIHQYGGFAESLFSVSYIVQIFNHADDFRNDYYILGFALLVLFSLVLLSSLKLFHLSRRVLIDYHPEYKP